MKYENNEALIKNIKTENILNDIRDIIELSRKQAYQAVNFALVQRNWLLGYRITEEELKGEHRAEYGKEIIKKLADELNRPPKVRPKI